MTDTDTRTPTATAQQASYEAVLALHALAGLVEQPAGEIDTRLCEVVRVLVDRAAAAGDGFCAPAWLLRHDGPTQELCSAGALLAEALDSGSTGLAGHLAVMHTAGLIEGLYGVAEFTDRTPLGQGSAATLYAPLDRAAGRTVLATLEVAPAARRGPVLPAQGGPREASAGPRTPTWSPFGEQFLLEADRALAAARTLLTRMGIAQPPVIRADFAAPGVLSPSTVADGSVAASLALGHLARETGLPTPASLGVLVLGGITPGGRWTESASPEPASDAAAHAGLAVLARTRRGWSLVRGAETTLDDDHDLAGACRLLWGEDWAAAAHALRGKALRMHGWEILHAPPRTPRAMVRGVPVDPDEPLLVEPPQVDVLCGQYTQHPALGLILGGQANSGKSVIARQVVARLERQKWQVVVLSPIGRELPPDGELPAVVQAALTRTGVTAEHRTLVVLENLHPVRNGRLGDAVADLAARLRISVLAVARYGNGSGVDWNTGTVSPVRAVLDDTAVRNLAERIVAEYPAGAARTAKDLLPVVIAAARGDLWILGRLIRDIAAQSTEVTDARAGAALAWFVQKRLADLDEAQLETVRTVAAVSLFGEPVPEELLGPIDKAGLTAIGVRSRDGLVRLASRTVARLVVNGSAGADPSDRTSVRSEPDALAYVVPYLLRLMTDGAPGRVVGLLRACRAHNEEVLPALLGEPGLAAGLHAWLERADPISAAAALRVCAEHLAGEPVSAALTAVLRALPTADSLDSRGLSDVARVIEQTHLHVAKTEAYTAFVTWLAGPNDGLRTVLERPASLADRLRLAWSLYDMDDAGCEMVVSQAELLSVGADASNSRDLILIRKLDGLVARCHGETGRPFDRYPLLKHRHVQDLLEARPAPDAGFAAVVAWISLRLHFEADNTRFDWEKELIAPYATRLRAALQQAPGSEITAALSDLAANNRAFCTRLLHSLKPEAELRSVLDSAAPADAAHLISVVARLHSATVRRLLFHERGGKLLPNRRLAERLAHRVRELPDAKGAGLLLLSAQKTDDLYASAAQRFAGLLAELIGRDLALELVAREIRPSVLYHFLQGLWAAGASYRHEVENSACDLVVRSITAPHLSIRSWAPRLALLLGADAYLGEAFLKRLAERIDRGTMSRLLARPGTGLDTLTHLHRLGRILHPEVTADYRVGRRQLQALSGARSISEVAEYLRVVATTLRMGGEESAASVVQRQLQEQLPYWDWATAITRARRPQEVAQALNNLSKLDPVVAGETLGSLEWAVGDDRLGFLEATMRRSAGEPVQVCELIHAVEAVRGSLGRELLTTLRESEHHWRRFSREVQYEQNPVTQAQVGRHLARLGVMPGRYDTHWIHDLVNDRWASTISLLASPRAVSELLQLAFTWQKTWGHGLAKDVQAGRLLDRIGGGAVEDLRQVPGLVNILELTGRGTLAGDILAELDHFDERLLAERLGLASGSALLRQLHRLSPHQVARIGSGLAAELSATLRQRLVVEPEAHWTRIGWAAQSLLEVGLEGLLPKAVPVLAPNPAFPVGLCWAAAWLPESDWTRRTLDTALPSAHLLGRVHRRPDHVFMPLIAAARTGRKIEAGDEATFRKAAAQASPGVLTLLWREGSAGTDTGPAGLLSALKPVVANRLNSPGLRVNSWLGELKQHVSKTPGPPPSGPAALMAALGVVPPIGPESAE
ncbi:hypothetical protein [Kitasatospora sp. KL5]|uniref:hypothetical protein n=1 Tax=Kitasatospora sp. KL5 TaxID=3425125 RepID=UPI003D6E3E28